MSDIPKRKHRKTGKPVGGARPGAGRPQGSYGVLPLNAEQAIKTCKLRIPEGTSHDAESLATEAFGRVVAVMRGEVLGASDVLKAAAMVRTEVCGPVEQRVKHSADVSIRVVDPYAEPQE